MRQTLPALVGALIGLALAVPAGAAGPRVGVVDDAGKYSPTPSSFYADLDAVGLSENRVTVLWDPASPSTIEEQGLLDRMVPAAEGAGVSIIFSVYPAKAVAFAVDRPARIAQFAAFLRELAGRYPQVTRYVVGNEPNQPRFWQPQFDAQGRNVSGASYEAVLAAGYDALKSVDPAIQVIGVALSPRGNDDPHAVSNVSTSPVRFLKALADAYRASGRRRPIMDALGFHPYPNANTNPPTKGYGWPDAGIPDLGRIEQAVQDGFAGTAQPTFQTGLKFVLDEIGWQARIPPADASLYTGAENVPTISEATQARWYAQVVRTVACDPSVSDVLIFHLIDEPSLNAGWQSGLERIDGSHRPSYDAVRRAIAATAAGCTGKLRTWTPATGVVGAAVAFPRAPVHGAFTLRPTAAEEATYVAGLFRVSAGGAAEVTRALSGSRAPALAAVAVSRGRLRAYSRRAVALRAPDRLAAGCYAYGVQLTAAMNPERRSVLVSRPFGLGGAACTGVPAAASAAVPRGL